MATFFRDRYSSQRTGLRVCMLPIMVHLLHSLCHFIYCPSSHLLDWRSKQKLLFSTSWRQLQGERRRRGVLGLTGELLPLMTGHMATCVFLSRSLSFPLDTHKVCLFYVFLNYFKAKVSRGKTPSWKTDKTKHRYSPNIQNPQPTQNEPSVATLLP